MRFHNQILPIRSRNSRVSGMQLKSFTDAVDENHMLRSTLGDIVAHILILNTHTSYIYIENRNYKVYLLIHNLI